VLADGGERAEGVLTGALKRSTVDLQKSSGPAAISNRPGPGQLAKGVDMRKTILILAAVGILTTAASASAAKCPAGAVRCGTGAARLTDGLVHHRTFTLRQARRLVVARERGMFGSHVRVGRCHWQTRWEAGCSVRFEGQIFTQASSAAVYTWTDLVARNQAGVAWALHSQFSIWGVDLHQLGVIRIG
jgi:hypothetical protein